MARTCASLAYCACAVAVLAAFAATASAQRCSAPCVRVSECPWLSALLNQEPRPPGLAALIRNLICGRDGRYNLVCCGPPPGQSQQLSEQPQPQPQPDPEPQPAGGPAWPQNTLQHPSLRLLPLDTCGVDDSDRITRGNVTAINQYPWMALLAYSSSRGGPRQYLCGGSLISSRYVLTAAHCVSSRKLGSYRVVGVRLGEWDLRTDVDCDGEICAPPPEDLGLEEVIPHASYQPATSGNDIALLRLDRDVAESSFIRPVCLPVSPEMRQATYVGTRLVVAGWGKTEERIPSPLKLYVGVPVVDLATCQERFREWNRRIVASQMCAGGSDGKDSCTGDSGGPLMAVDGQPPRGFVVGVVSFGYKECGSEGIPAVYTRVSSFVTWILDNMRP